MKRILSTLILAKILIFVHFLIILNLIYNLVMFFGLELELLQYYQDLIKPIKLNTEII